MLNHEEKNVDKLNMFSGSLVSPQSHLQMTSEGRLSNKCQ